MKYQKQNNCGIQHIKNGVSFIFGSVCVCMHICTYDFTSHTCKENKQEFVEGEWVGGVGITRYITAKSSKTYVCMYIKLNNFISE